MPSSDLEDMFMACQLQFYVLSVVNELIHPGGIRLIGLNEDAVTYTTHK